MGLDQVSQLQGRSGRRDSGLCSVFWAALVVPVGQQVPVPASSCLLVEQVMVAAVRPIRNTFLSAVQVHISYYSIAF